MVDEARGRDLTRAIQRVRWSVVGVLMLAGTVFGGPAHAAVLPFACIDVNHDGKCGTGDTDITPDLKQYGSVAASGDLVFPAELKTLSVRSDMMIYTDGAVTINAHLRGSRVMVSAGSIAMGPNSSIDGIDMLDLVADGSITLGDKAALRLTRGTLSLMAINGDIVFGKSVVVSARDGVWLSSLGQGITVSPGSWWRTNGALSLSAAGDIRLNSGTMQVDSALVRTDGHLIEFRGNWLRVDPHDGLVSMYAAGSTIDVRGTKFYVPSNNLAIDAESVLK